MVEVASVAVGVERGIAVGVEVHVGSGVIDGSAVSVGSGVFKCNSLVLVGANAVRVASRA